MTGPPYPGTLRPMWVAAAWAKRPQPTLRTWYRRGLLVPKACHIPTRALLFDLNDVAVLAARPARRYLTERDG